MLKCTYVKIGINLPIVGANWDNAANGGALALNLNDTRSNSNANVSLRDSIPRLPEMTKVNTGIEGCTFLFLTKSLRFRNI